MLMTLSGVSSTALAAESSSDTYELTEDVGIMPTAIFQGQYGQVPFFTDDQLEIVKGYINKLPITQHYFLMAGYVQEETTTTFRVDYWLFLPQSNAYTVFSSSSGYYGYNLGGYSDVYRFRFFYNYPLEDGLYPDLPSDGNWFEFMPMGKYLNVMMRCGVSQGQRRFQFVYSQDGVRRTVKDLSLLFSDVPAGDSSQGFSVMVPDITNRREVLPQYATLFGLAVFLIFDILRGFWRSFRGRDT